MSKFFWLKLKKDFFKRHDLMNLRSMENGLIYEAIFIHLMAEAIDHDGFLRYSEKKPYTARTLAPLATTDEKTMEKALEAFTDLELIEIGEDGTIYVPLSMSNMGSDTSWAEKKRQYRDKSRTSEGQKEDMSSNCPRNVLEEEGQKKDMSDKRLEYRDKRLENRDKIEDSENNKLFSSSSSEEEWKPKKDDVFSYALENHLTCVSVFWDYYQARNWMIKDSPIRDWRSLLQVWEKNSKGKAKANVSVMENEYTKEHIRQKEIESLKDLDDLLAD